MKIFDLALKDLYQILRDAQALLFLVAMPIVFTLFMGFAYSAGENGAENAAARLELAVAVETDSDLAEMLFTRLAESNGLNPIQMERDEALEALRQGELSGVLVIPAGFSEQDTTGSFPQLTLIAETGSPDAQSLFQLLRVPVSQLMSAVEIAAISADVQGDPSEFAPALELAWASWNEQADQERVQLKRAVAQTEDSWFGDNPYNQASPGILVQFAIMGLVTSGQILVSERKTRTLQRMKTTAVHSWEIVTGHLLAMFGLVIIQTVLLVVFGQLVLGVDYFSELSGTLVISIALGLWVASMGLLIGLLANSDDQVVLFSLIAMFLFSALGGTWFPLEASGGAFAAIGRWMPSAWAMTGYQNILIRGLDVSSAWLPAAVILVYAAGFFLLAVMRFRKMEL